MKVYAMSDIHGYLHEFETALKKIDLSGDNLLILLGDYIHGPNSYGVLDKIIDLQEKFGSNKVIALLGNHEEMALNGSWNINEERFGCKNTNNMTSDSYYLEWMSNLPLYYVVGNAIFVHAGIDEEAASFGYWELGTVERIFTNKFPAETGKIDHFDMKIIAGHIGTNVISNNPNYHDIFYDGGSHYFIDGTVKKSGNIPVLMYDTLKDQFFEITNNNPSLISPYVEDIL